ncbi:MAG: tRNA pseudouridine(38-40) synthase TruA [Candidatus Omnitrophota bacterium]
MRNIRLEIEYDGSNYAGWQVQPKGRAKTIQAVIEKTLRKILQEKIKLIASGRTDAGVHARAQVANFFTRSGMKLSRLKIALNGVLPEDIKVIRLGEEGPRFHSRFKAKAKVYRYTILNRDYSSPLLRNTVYFYPHPLDIKLMRKEALALLGRHNFSAFCAAKGKEKNPVKTIKKLSIIKKKDFIYIDIEADGFLYNMVRNIAGTLVEIGRGSLASGSLRKILLSHRRSLAGPTIPAKGLCLLKVKY